VRRTSTAFATHNAAHHSLVRDHALRNWGYELGTGAHSTLVRSKTVIQRSQSGNSAFRPDWRAKLPPSTNAASICRQRSPGGEQPLRQLPPQHDNNDNDNSILILQQSGTGARMPLCTCCPIEGRIHSQQPLLTATSPARLQEIGEGAPQTKDYDSFVEYLAAIAARDLRLRRLPIDLS
jgi:hypothetical protein